ncbi:HAD family phosphatase [Methanolobus sp. ZRKC3]|uniref:HAD family hydrolase n=1 Tax=Methanolobus sp. ZRKC3 TaxID=3125786 RepID=UPI003247AF12
MKKGIIFDVDGVLVDSMPYHASAWVKAFETVGINVREDEIYEIEGSNHVGVINLIFEKAGRVPDTEMYEDLLQKKRSHFMKNNKSLVFENMQECLGNLKSHYKLAVASGADRTIVTSLMDKFYPDIFDVIVSGQDVKHGKPDPEPYLKAADMLGLDARDCLVVENAPLGVISAKSAGMYCVVVPTYLAPEKLQEADLLLEDHSALVDYLNKLAASESSIE